MPGESVADIGYSEAIVLIARGRLNLVVLWKPEAFNRYRTAMVNGQPNQEWLDKFNQDLELALQRVHVASFIGPDDEKYPADKVPAFGPFVVLKVVRDPGPSEGVAVVIVQPEADQVLKPVPRFRLRI